MSVGFIADWRKELDSDIWKMPPLYHRVWQWLKYNANYCEAKIPDKDGGYLTLNAGQLATSIRIIGRGVSYYDGLIMREVNPKTVKKILDWLEGRSMIEVRSNSKGTIITIRNWERYQIDKEVSNTIETLKQQHVDTNNNIINKNNNINKKNNNNTSRSMEYKDSKTKFRFANDSSSQPCIHTGLLIRKMRENNHMVKVPKENTAQFDNWCIELDRMNRIDCRDWIQIEKVILFSQEDSFWKSVILSPQKLRSKFDQLWLKMSTKNDRIQNTETSRDQLDKAFNDPDSAINKFLSKGRK